MRPKGVSAGKGTPCHPVAPRPRPAAGCGLRVLPRAPSPCLTPLCFSSAFGAVVEHHTHLDVTCQLPPASCPRGGGQAVGKHSCASRKRPACGLGVTTASRPRLDAVTSEALTQKWLRFTQGHLHWASYVPTCPQPSGFSPWRRTGRRALCRVVFHPRPQPSLKLSVSLRSLGQTPSVRPVSPAQVPLSSDEETEPSCLRTRALLLPVGTRSRRSEHAALAAGGVGPADSSRKEFVSLQPGPSRTWDTRVASCHALWGLGHLGRGLLCPVLKCG